MDLSCSKNIGVAHKTCVRLRSGLFAAGSSQHDKRRAGSHIACCQGRHAGLPDGLIRIHRRRFTPGKAGGKQQQITGQLFAASLQNHRIYRVVIAADKPFNLCLIV